MPHRIHFYLLSTIHDEKKSDKLPDTVNDKSKSQLENVVESKSNETDKADSEMDSEMDYVYEYLVKSESEENNVIPEQDNNTQDENKPEDNIKIYYQRYTVSKYSKLPSILELSKKDAYYHEAMIHTLDPQLIREEDFEPLDFGYYISCIKVNDATLFCIDLQDDCTKKYEFPSVDLTTKKRHEVLYDDSLINGYCEGRYGVGVIPFCDNTCQPIITWKRNGMVMKQGLGQYWFDSSDLISDVGADWSCQVTCNDSKFRNMEN